MLKKLAKWILRKEINELLIYSGHAFNDGWEQGRWYEAHKTKGVILGRYRRELEGILEDKRI